ncbi:IS5 family transposase [Actinomadura syzygii]|uniref:IS5 family transposase n=1 Tax=Actinomadura syzygii TaxID=1427538 RepID=UPI00361931D5
MLGGGRRRYGGREVLAAIIFVATTGCTWQQLPPVFGPSGPTAHRRFTVECRAGVGQAAPARAGRAGCARRAGLVAMRDRLGQRPGRQRGELTGPNPVDRGKRGSKIHLLTDRAGLPLSVGISAANTHDKLALQPLVRGIAPVRSRRGPRRRGPAKLHGDKGYDYADLRRWLRSRGITPRIARRGIESSDRRGRYRWVVERTVSWLSGCRRLHRRYERTPERFLAFVGIAATLICHRQLAK